MGVCGSFPGALTQLDHQKLQVVASEAAGLLTFHLHLLHFCKHMHFVSQLLKDSEMPQFVFRQLFTGRVEEHSDFDI